MTEKNGIQLLGDGLETILNPDKFREALYRVSEAAFATVFHAQDEGILQWKRAGEDLRDFVTEVVVENGRCEAIIISVFFLVSANGDGFINGFLMLGSKEHAPCRNDADPRVKRLYEQITGQGWVRSV